MTASDKRTNQIKKDLLCRSHPHRKFAATWRLPAQVTNFSNAQTMVGLKSRSTDPLQGLAQRPGMSRALQLQRRRWVWLVLGAAGHARTFFDAKWVEFGSELPIDVIGPPAPARFFFTGRLGSLKRLRD